MLIYDSLFKMNLNVRKQDLRIASIAMERGWTVATCNISDFLRIPGCNVVDSSREVSTTAQLMLPFYDP